MERMMRKNPPIQETNQHQKSPRVFKLPGPTGSRIIDIPSPSPSISLDASTIRIDDDRITSTQDSQIMSSADLNGKFKQKDIGLQKILILDCRDTIELTRDPIKNSYIPSPQIPENQRNLILTNEGITNAHISSSPFMSQYERFARLADVMQFYFEHLPTHIVTINLPGHYDKIILYDGFSHANSICPPLSVMLRAMSRWNEGTKTRIIYLDGSYNSIKKSLSNLLTSANEKMQLSSHQKCPPILNNLRENPPIFPLTKNTSKTWENLQRYMSTLDEAIVKTDAKLELLKKLKVLEEINGILKKEEFTEFKKLLDLRVKDDFKCQKCKEVFSGTIFQCSSGHCICPECLEKCLNCSVGGCGMPFVYRHNNENCQHKLKFRCLAVEKLMATKLTVKCPNDNGCGKILTYNQISAHVVDCVKIRGGVGKRLEDEIAMIRGDIRIITEQLVDINKSLFEMEFERSRLVEVDHTHVVCRDFTEKINAKKSKLHELQNAILLESFFMNEVNQDASQEN